MIIGNDGFIDRKIINRTIHLHGAPFISPVPGFFLSKLEKEIKKVRGIIEIFWREDLLTILDRRDTFPRSNLLKNQDQQSWLPILVPSKAYSALFHQPIYFKNMLTLAKKMITSRTMEESAIPLEQKVLEATQAFIETLGHETIKNDEGIDFYFGFDLCEFIRKMLDLPKLRQEKISEILNDRVLSVSLHEIQ